MLRRLWVACGHLCLWSLVLRTTCGHLCYVLIVQSVQAGDEFLMLVTDGVTAGLSDAEMAARLQDTVPAPLLCCSLIPGGLP